MTTRRNLVCPNAVRTDEKVLAEGIQVMCWSKRGTAVSCRIPGWIAGTMTVAAMIASCGSSVASSSPVSASPSPRWQSPLRSTARTATLSPTAPPPQTAWSEPVCQAKDLNLSRRYGGAGAGNHFIIYVVTNGSAPCAVGSSRPTLKETNQSGQESPVLKEGRRPGTGAAVVIQPGQQASFYVDWGSSLCYNAALRGEARKPHQLSITFSGPSGPKFVLDEPAASPCSQEDVAVSPVQNGIVSTGYTQPLPTPSP